MSILAYHTVYISYFCKQITHHRYVTSCHGA